MVRIHLPPLGETYCEPDFLFWLLGDKVYFAAADAVLVALDAKTGNEVWKTTVEDYTHGYYMSLAPRRRRQGQVGVSGGELGSSAQTFLTRR